MPDSQELREQVESLFSARLGIYGIRRRLNELKPRLATNVSEAINIARRELCSAPVRRLEIAENQIRELEDMLELNRTAISNSISLIICTRHFPRGVHECTARLTHWGRRFCKRR
jgi:hypothetical protein